MAAAAGIDHRHLARIEPGEAHASVDVLARIAAVLGSDLSIRAFPNTGARIRDRLQAPMVEALIRQLHPRFEPNPEVVVHRPARGVIDLAIVDHPARLIIASEFHSQIRRLEQQLAWHRQKADALPSSELWRRSGFRDEADVSRMLVLRSTRETRDLARAFEATLAAAYPARTSDAVDALRGGLAWPGPALIWIRVEGGAAALLDGPPRGVRLGRARLGTRSPRQAAEDIAPRRHGPRPAVLGTRGPHGVPMRTRRSSGGVD